MDIHNPLDPTEILADLAEIQADVIVIDANVDDILAVTNALPTLTETGGTVTTDGTEQNVYINSNPLGEFNPIAVLIDCSHQIAGETLIIRLYYDIAPGGHGLLLADEVTYVGVITPPIIIIGLSPNRYGVQVTIEGDGANAYPWDVHYEI